MRGALQLSGPRPKAGTGDAWVDDTSHTVRCMCSMREALQLSEPARLHGVHGFLYTGHPIVFSVLRSAKPTLDPGAVSRSAGPCSYTAVMSFEILFPFGLWVSEPGWLLNHSQLV